MILLNALQNYGYVRTMPVYGRRSAVGTGHAALKHLALVDPHHFNEKMFVLHAQFVLGIGKRGINEL